MRNISEYNKFYKTEILPVLEPLEMTRLKTKQVVIRTVFAGMLLIAVSLLLFLTLFKERTISGMVSYMDWDELSVNILGLFYIPLIIIFYNPVTAGITAVIAGIYWYKSKEYKDSFKTSVVEPIMKYIEPNFTYYPEYKADRLQSRMISPKILRFFLKIKSQGFFIMNNQEQSYKNFNFFEVATSLRVFTWFIILCLPFIIDAQPSIFVFIAIFICIYIFRFNGLFFTMNFNKNFMGETIIVSNSYLNLNRKLKKVKIEDNIFERHYNVYSSDQIQARYILSASFIEKLNDFTKKVKVVNGFKIIFKYNTMYIKIPYSRPLFEPKVFKTLYDIKSAQEYYHDINLGLDMIQELSLNTRIWTKV